MKILYCGLLYNYGKKEEGSSYEHFNIEAGFRDCAERGIFEVDYVYPDCCENLLDTTTEAILNNGYDAIFNVAFNEHLDLPEGAAKLALRMDIPVIQWDCDSSWRFDSWIAPRKDRVSHFVTTHSATMGWYEKRGMNVIKSQWAGSPHYSPQDLEKKHDVTFIGQKHGRMPDGRFMRAEIIDAMMAAGISIDLFGSYWDGYENWHGYLTDFQEMIQAFNQSKICLNLSNPWHHGSMPQIKGRHFEIPQTGRMQICTPADDIESYFVPDKEIVIANNVGELIEKTRYYLEHEDEREVIAAAGRERMLRDHQWSNRLVDIFKEICS